MDDEERLEYMEWRNKRDVVRGKSPAPAAKADEKKATRSPDKKDEKKDKKPFTDRVLERALEQLRKELPKVGAAPELLERKSA